MGNTLPKNPTREDYLAYADKQKGETATEIYERIASELKSEKKWEEAANILRKCIPLHKDESKLNELYESIANIYKRVQNVEKYIETLATIIGLNKTNFSKCGKYCICIAEEYEKNEDIQLAIKFYTQAADYYEVSNMPHYSAKNKLKVACLMSLTENKVNSAAEIFEKIADEMYTDKNKILTASYVFNAGLCKLKGDGNFRYAIEYYGVKYPQILASTYYTFLLQIVSAVETKNVDMYQSIVSNYNLIFGVDNWTNKMFKIIRENMDEIDLK
jgi:alpha-soluble NSF attachment protein